MDSKLAIATIKESCYQVGYPINDKEHERRKLINQSCDYAIDCIEKLNKIKQIVKEVESLRPEVAIGDREGIRKIREVLKMSRITPLMTSLHEGHKAEERLKCIDNMLFKKCEDTKDTILQAFWWYRKYTKAKLQKLEQIEQIINSRDGFYLYDNLPPFQQIKEVLEQE